MRNIKFLLAGVVFGIILVKSQVISWFRIQEMFRLQAFHMYGIIGSAIVVGMVSILLLKRFNVKTSNGEPIVIPPEAIHLGQCLGRPHLRPGLGYYWRLSGAFICPIGQRFLGDRCYFAKRCAGYLGLWGGKG